jgi:hypothetical protein
VNPSDHMLDQVETSISTNDFTCVTAWHTGNAPSCPAHGSEGEEISEGVAVARQSGVLISGEVIVAMP